ncbi:MAG: hypothetical protein KA313_10105 [Pseudarcicella sp.]|nr:hypothetical protein [Pseudarcicella sp.]MBP6411441.1 hypothetical protein [Pseudarcicella sp.]
MSFLTENDCSLFETFLQIKQIGNKSILLEEEQVCKFLGFINKGTFYVFYLSEGKEINTHFSFEKEFVANYDSFFQQSPKLKTINYIFTQT